MRVGEKLLELARGRGARVIFAVGTGKGVGKTTALRAIYEAACRARLRVGLASIGPKLGLQLQPDTLFVTARSLLPRSPASEILKTTRLESPVGPLLFARTVYGGRYDLAGPSSASGLREVIEELSAGCDVTLVDGAIDRLATLASAAGAIVLSCGAAAANSAPEAVEEVAALAARLRVPACDPQADAIDLEGALTAPTAAAFIAARESRQIVVRDATQIVISGRALSEALARLRVRCRYPLDVVATTVCAVAPERSFDPIAFLHDVAAATSLPAFDVFAGKAAA
ncbi:MAG: hypothetical protein WAK16_03190 [Candidatus Cybelea sp.]